MSTPKSFSSSTDAEDDTDILLAFPDTVDTSLTVIDTINTSLSVTDTVNISLNIAEMTCKRIYVLLRSKKKVLTIVDPSKSHTADCWK